MDAVFGDPGFPYDFRRTEMDKEREEHENKLTELLVEIGRGVADLLCASGVSGFNAHMVERSEKIEKLCQEVEVGIDADGHSIMAP